MCYYFYNWQVSDGLLNTNLTKQWLCSNWRIAKLPPLHPHPITLRIYSTKTTKYVLHLVLNLFYLLLISSTCNLRPIRYSGWGKLLCVDSVVVKLNRIAVSHLVPVVLIINQPVNYGCLGWLGGTVEWNTNQLGGWWIIIITGSDVMPLSENGCYFGGFASRGNAIWQIMTVEVQWWMFWNCWSNTLHALHT